MVPDYYQLPSLKMLRTFEVAARHGSFKLAAEELNVTPGAVSHQIKSLESDLGVALFWRSHRNVELTAEGWTLYETLSRGFAEFSRSLNRLRNTSDPRHVSIGATTAVSSLWLTPMLIRFWREHGDITISQEVRDRPFLRPITLDLVIEYNVETPKDAAGMLFRDRLLPLCSPTFQNRELATLDDLATADLIHLDAKETNWTSWNNWFASQGYNGPIAARHRVNNYTIALQLAQEGNGVVLGWKSLVKPLLDAGKLLPLTRYEQAAPGAFYLVQGLGDETEELSLVKGWLLGQAG